MNPDFDDIVFRALADPTRRRLLDTLRHNEGMPLRQLCEDIAMTRQSVTQHVDLLVTAGLVVVVRRGRERWHYLNAAPIHDIARRWINQFDQVHLAAIDTIRHIAEEAPMTDTTDTDTLPTYIYVSYIRSTPERVWQALTDPRVTALYWNGMANTSDWHSGSTWTHLAPGDDGHYDIWGRVLESIPPRRLSFTFQPAAQDLDQEGSVVTYLIEPLDDVVRLTVTHEGLPDRETFTGISQGWPTVLSNLKSYLETGEALDEASWTLMSR